VNLSQRHGEELDQQKDVARPSPIERTMEVLKAENALLRKLVADLALATAVLKERLEAGERSHSPASLQASTGSSKGG
jgi:hypothetical protein